MRKFLKLSGVFAIAMAMLLGSSMTALAAAKKPSMQDAYAALTNTSKSNKTTYGNPGIWTNPNSNLSYTKSTPKATAKPKATPKATPKPTAKPTATPKKSSSSGTKRTPTPSNSNSGNNNSNSSHNSNTNNNNESNNYTAPTVYPDLTVKSVTPTQYRYGSTVITLVTVQNLNAADTNDVVVELVASSGTQTQTIDVSSLGKSTALFMWTAPNTPGTLSLTATVNKAQTITESTYANNSYTVTATVKGPLPIVTGEVESKVDLPTSVPAGDNMTDVTWTEPRNNVDTSFWAHLSLTATATPNYSCEVINTGIVDGSTSPAASIFTAAGRKSPNRSGCA